MIYKFFRQETGEYEDVADEKWKWIATYNDGTLLKQFDNEGLFHQFKEIDQSKLLLFRLVSDAGMSKTLIFKPGWKLIHFYRNTVLENGQVHLRMTVMGYEKPGERFLLVVMPNDEVILTDDLENIGFDIGENNG